MLFSLRDGSKSPPLESRGLSDYLTRRIKWKPHPASFKFRSEEMGSSHLLSLGMLLLTLAALLGGRPSGLLERPHQEEPRPWPAAPAEVRIRASPYVVWHWKKTERPSWTISADAAGAERSHPHQTLPTSQAHERNRRVLSHHLRKRLVRRQQVTGPQVLFFSKVT